MTRKLKTKIEYTSASYQCQCGREQDVADFYGDVFRCFGAELGVWPYSVALLAYGLRSQQEDDSSRNATRAEVYATFDSLEASIGQLCAVCWLSQALQEGVASSTDDERQLKLF